MSTKKELQAELDRLRALAGQTAAAVPTAPAASPNVASLATGTIPAAAWEELEASVITAFDTKGRDETLLGAVRKFATVIPAAWRGLPLTESVVDPHVDKVRTTLTTRYGDTSKMTKEKADQTKRTLAQAVSRSKSLFMCAAILPVAWEQGFEGGIQATSVFCTQLKDNEFNLAKVFELRKKKDATNAELVEEWRKLLDKLISIEGVGDDVPKCLTAKTKAMLVHVADKCAVNLKKGDKHRNLPLATE